MIRPEPLSGRHARNGFDCGAAALNLWLRQTALQHQARGISRSFVVVPDADADVQAFKGAGYADVARDSILGYYALSSSLVVRNDVPADLARRFPRQLPVTRLGRLAVRADMQGQGLGRWLLADAFTRSRVAAQSVGSAGLFVDAKDEAAAAFYRRFGFIACAGQPLKLFIPL